MVTSEWKMIDQQGKKNLSRIFRCISENFPWFSASSGDLQKLPYGNINDDLATQGIFHTCLMKTDIG